MSKSRSGPQVFSITDENLRRFIDDYFKKQWINKADMVKLWNFNDSTDWMMEV